MTSTRDFKIFEDIFTESWREIDTLLRDRLSYVGIKDGATIRAKDAHGRMKTFRISHINTRAERDMRRYGDTQAWRNGCAAVSIYGVQLRKDNTYGSSIHYIGRPSDIEVMK